MSSEFPVIDPDAIANLRDLSPGDDSFLIEIIQTYSEDTPKRIEEARAAFAAGDAAAFIRATHTIKGSSSNLGAERLRRAAERFEHTARKSGLAGMEQAVAELEAEFAQTRAALLEFV
jgi:HPt (histidine-containing phosphotransfer) domain-containing protein